MPAIARTTITPLGAHAGKFTIVLHGVNDSWIASLQNQGDEWQRLGQAGSGAQIIGTRGQKTKSTGWHGESTLAAALTFIGNFESLEEEVCQVADAWGRTLARVRLSGVSAVPRNTKGPILSGTTQITYRCEVAFSAERLPDG